MKQSKLYIPTSKDVPSQAVAQSHILAVKAGLVHQTAAGIYTYLPMGLKILENIKAIVKEEIDAIGGNELQLPFLEPAEIWQKTGRWQDYGDELFRVRDRHGREFALGPTHEEVVTDLIKNFMGSYKKYPLNVYQIANKFRDEARPRFGLLRGREFIMMDGYSFHTSPECLEETYMQYYQAYQNIFDRLGLKYRIVTADNGAMGGSYSHEFMVLADIGEDTICYEEDSIEAFNIEVAATYNPERQTSPETEIKLVDTKDISKIKDLVANFDVLEIDAIKAMCFMTPCDQLVIALVAGNYEINDLKLAKVVGLGELHLANDAELEKFGLVKGFIGAYNLEVDAIIVADDSVSQITCGTTGANQLDKHYFNVSYNRDLSHIKTYDLRFILEGEQMTKSGQPVSFAKTIEVGHIFALGDKYTKSLEVKYLSKEQKLETPIMGCYGIGVSRLLSAILEQNNDENGMILPSSVTPYDVHLIALDYDKKEDKKQFTDELHQKLKALGLKVLLDDRVERPGIKFAEADLLGFPMQIVVGRMWTEDTVEVKVRKTLEKEEMTLDALFAKLAK